MTTVIGKPTYRQVARQAVRQDEVASKYWYPKYQEWMTLTEYAYYQQVNSNKENNNAMAEV